MGSICCNSESNSWHKAVKFRSWSNVNGGTSSLISDAKVIFGHLVPKFSDVYPNSGRSFILCLISIIGFGQASNANVNTPFQATIILNDDILTQFVFGTISSRISCIDPLTVVLIFTEVIIQYPLIDYQTYISILPSPRHHRHHRHDQFMGKKGYSISSSIYPPQQGRLLLLFKCWCNMSIAIVNPTKSWYKQRRVEALQHIKWCKGYHTLQYRIFFLSIHPTRRNKTNHDWIHSSWY